MTARRPLREALDAAKYVVALLRDGCERIEIAGPIRRRRPDVKDIEFVVVPRYQPDLFGGPGTDLLNQQIRLCVQAHDLQWCTGKTGRRAPEHLDDRRYYQLSLVAREPWSVDLFVVRPPAQWGAIMAIRTGPDEYVRELVTSARRQGLHCEDGRLLTSDGNVISTPTERDFIEMCGQSYLPPEDRR
jgi:DNA polymerase/3'-5' exonuclease PolX